MEKIRS
jgi:hypothetical protein